jgi:hypothetical protein
LISGSKFDGSPPAGGGEPTPVYPSHAPFQLHLIGARVLLIICVHEAGPVYGHIIQSRQFEDAASAPKENSRVPVVAILTTIQVLFASPVNKQPELADPGFVEGFETEPDVNSTTDPEPLGSTAKDALVQMLTAPEQSDAITGPGGGGGGVPQGEQMTLANHPGALIIPSDVKTSVKHPEVEVIFPGIVVPVSVANKGEAEVGPL